MGLNLAPVLAGGTRRQQSAVLVHSPRPRQSVMLSRQRAGFDRRRRGWGNGVVAVVVGHVNAGTRNHSDELITLCIVRGHCEMESLSAQPLARGRPAINCRYHCSKLGNFTFTSSYVRAGN